MSVRGVLGNKICGLIKGGNVSLDKYKTHDGQEIDVNSFLYLSSNRTSLLF